MKKYVFSTLNANPITKLCIKPKMNTHSCNVTCKQHVLILFYFFFIFFSSGSIEEKGGKRLSSKDIVDTAQSQPLMDHLLHMMLFVCACLRVLSGSTTSLNTTLQLVKRQKE